MKINIDLESRTLCIDDGKKQEVLELFSRESFERISRLWTDVGWVQKYSYGYSWLGRPIIQLPDDMIRIQEVIYHTRPDVIIETGVAHGGSLIFCSSLLELMGKGRVIGIDVEIRPHNRAAIEAHPMSRRITLIEGNSVDPTIVSQVKALVAADERVMLILDSNHSHEHVSAELAAYSNMVTPGCYILSQDGIMEFVAGMPRTEKIWSTRSPVTANREFLAAHPEFMEGQPSRIFDETLGTPDCTHHPHGWMLRKAAAPKPDKTAALTDD